MGFGVWRRCRCFFSVLQGRGRRAEVARGREINCLSSGRVLLPDSQEIPSSVSKRFPSLGKLHKQTTTRPQGPEPESSSESAPGCRLEIQPDPSASHAHGAAHNGQFPLRFHPPPRKQSPVAALRTCAASGPPISLSGGTACMYNWTGATWAQALSRRAGTASRTEKGTPAVCRPSP